MSEKDPTEQLEKTKDYLQTWLDNLRQANIVAPTVQESLEELSWALKAMYDRPPESNNVSMTLVSNWAETAHNNITITLPQIPSYNLTSLIQVSSATSSSNTAVMSYIFEVGKIETPNVKEYFQKQVHTYRTLQEQHSRPKRVREMIAQRWQSCLNRFDMAFEAQRRFKTGVAAEADAGIAIRNALEAIKGELFEEARRNTRENMTWAEMARRLCRNPQHMDLLLNQEMVHKALHGHLSNLAKGRPADQIPSIDAIWTMFLDHLLIMLT